jgi:hypothetical protein
MKVLTFAVVALGALAVLWVLGGFLLRLIGYTLALAGAGVAALTGNANGALVFAIGIALWLAGHWLYALRHHEYKSPLAGYLFMRWVPGWLDPTRGWAIPVGEGEAVDSERRRR